MSNVVIELKHSVNREISVPTPGRHTKTIVIYGTSMDLCMSLQILFEDQYNMLIATDPEMLIMLVKTFGPDLVITDTVPTLYMRKCFETIRRKYPNLRIILFTSSRIDDSTNVNKLHSLIDAVFYKPISSVELIRSIQSLVHE